MAEPKAESDEDLLARAKEEFKLCEKDPAGNRTAYTDDTQFVRLPNEFHWPEDIKKYREGRPCLAFDRLSPIVRQVVNDARQNKPSIKVLPVDSGADKKTADVLSGLIRNIENSSNADVAYDTAIECAVAGGFGYFRIEADYARDDTFEMDISIERIPNPLCVFPDPNSLAADSSDWNRAFIVTKLTKADYESQYGDGEKVDWDSKVWDDWLDDDGVQVAEWWTRDEYEKTIVKTKDGRTFDKKDLETDDDLSTALQFGLIEIAEERVTKCYRVTQRILSGAKILATNAWPGRYIPIIPVYGDEFWIEGKRYLRSLINHAKDAQMMFDIMRSTSVELFGLSPKVPYLVEAGSVDDDIDRWNTANTANHPFLEYAKGSAMPQRQQIDPGPATGAMSEALAAADDMKAITGINDASQGLRSNETSGKAIMARQREGDVSTFHFGDNQRRAIRHAGRVIVDLIPHYYDQERVVRVIGEDGAEDAVPINQQFPQTDPKTGEQVMQPAMNDNGQPQVDDRGEPVMAPVMAMHDLTTGKYDVVVSSGPSFTTRREEAAYSMTEALRAFPDGASIIMPELAKNLDWPGADKIAEKLEEMGSNKLPPEVQKLIEEGKAKIADQERQIQQLTMDRAVDQEKLQADIEAARMTAAADYQIEEIRIASQEKIAMRKIQSEAAIAAYKAELSAQAEAQRPIVQAAPRAAA